MKIGVDASSLIAQKTGIGSFASHLLEEFGRSSGGIDFLRLAPDVSGDMNTPQRLLWEAFTLPRLAEKEGVDAVYSPGFSPPAGPLRKIVTVHDVIGLLFPRNVGPASRFYWTRWLPANLKKAHKLVASSECTRRDIVRLLGISEEKIEVVPLAVRDTYRVISDGGTRARLAAEKYGIRGRYLMSVSSLEPRKNHLRLVRVFAKILRDIPDLSLVIIGKPAGAETELRDFIAERRLEDSVKLLGYAPEEDVISLYNGALGYAMISLYEGFGLPALEAMRCGLTGIVADNSSLPEVTGGTAFQAAPEDEPAIESALRALALDGALRNRMGASALEHSRRFSIQKTASRMVEIFKKECSS